MLLLQYPDSHATKSCKCVAFRLDDIQDYYLNDVQIEIINTFQEKNASLTIGIIGNYFGEDARLVTYIHAILLSSSTTIEVANHGWNHEDFTLVQKQQQSELMKRTNDKIIQTLGAKSVSFIAPFNAINKDTLLAMQENNLRFVSANVTRDPPPYLLEDQILYHLPGTTFTGNLNDNDTAWFNKSHTETFADIQENLDSYGFAVVMLHPQEYAVRDGLNFQNKADLYQIKELDLLIDKIRDSGVTIVTMPEIIESGNAKDSIFVPSWIKTTAGWWSEGKVTDSEFLSGIEYMYQNKIIKIGSTSVKEVKEQTVPGWIKNNAMWWSQNLISDNEFVAGIRFLAENGIIKISV